MGILIPFRSNHLPRKIAPKTKPHVFYSKIILNDISWANVSNVRIKQIQSESASNRKIWQTFSLNGELMNILMNSTDLKKSLQ